MYMVRCADGSLYTGITTDVTRRIAEHNTGNSVSARYTRTRRPVRLVYQETAASRGQAARREYAIKSLSRPDKEHLIRQCG